MTLNHVLKKGGLSTLSFMFSLLFADIGYATSVSVSQNDLDSKIGQAIFEKLWVFAPASTKSSDGLGPFYNARSCQQCHDSSKEEKNNIPASLVIQLSIEPTELDPGSNDIVKINGFMPEPTYGKQVQTFAHPGAKPEATIAISHQHVDTLFPDGEIISLTKPKYHFTNLGYGEFDKAIKYSPRVAPRMIGLSGLSLISDQNILANADPDDVNADGISGKINWVWDAISQTTAIGRFGWKASKPTLEQQNLAALATDIGVSSWLFPQPQGDCTKKQSHCVNLAKSTETNLNKEPVSDNDIRSGDAKQRSVEATKEITDLLHLFTKTMGQTPLPRPLKQPKDTIEYGKQLFKKIGCQNCHLNFYDKTMNTDADGTSNSGISAYTDLLLHDMGVELADDRKEFAATGREWRTAPLLGIADYLTRSPNPVFLHDGRARSITEAILWHGGESAKSKRAFMTLSKAQRINLINFVESL